MSKSKHNINELVNKMEELSVNLDEYLVTISKDIRFFEDKEDETTENISVANEHDTHTTN